MSNAENTCFTTTLTSTVIMAEDSRQFLLADLTRLQADLTLLAHRVADDQYDPLPNPVWNSLLEAQEQLHNVTRRWRH